MAAGPLTVATFSGGLVVVALQSLRGLVWPASSFSVGSSPQAPIASGDAVAFSGPSFFSNADLGDRHVCECRRQATNASFYEEEEDSHTNQLANVTDIYNYVDAEVLSWGVWLFVGADAFIAFIVLVWFATARIRTEARKRHADAEDKLRSEVPELKSLHVLQQETCKITELVPQFALLSRQLAEIFNHSGAEMQTNFADWVSAGEQQGDTAGARRMLSAWHGVGAAQATFSDQVLAAGAKLEKDMANLELERIDCAREAAKLTKKLVVANAAQGTDRVKEDKEMGTLQAQIQGKASQMAASKAKSDIKKSLEAVEQRLGGIRCQCSSTLNAAVDTCRRSAQEVGKRLGSLEPQPIRSGNIVRGEMVNHRLKHMGTAQGRQLLRQEEESQDGGPVLLEPEQPLRAPPYSQLGQYEWQINKIYAHQVLKIGMRWLDEHWDEKDLLVFPQKNIKSGTPTVLKEKLISDLVSGVVNLQSVVSNDLAAAQGDMQHLSLRQLLRLRVRHLDFVPSGCGSNTVTGAQQTHETLLCNIDAMLFRQLGMTLISECAPSTLSRELSTSGYNRYGKEAVYIVAAAIVVQEPAWWCWWLSDNTRVFFCPKTFKCKNTFPDGGVLSLTDYSKRDAHEPTGHLHWFDWHVQRVNSEDDLPKVRPSGNVASASSSSTACYEDPGSAATGAGVAVGLSPQLLTTMRGKLRPTEGMMSSPLIGTPKGASPVEAG